MGLIESYHPRGEREDLFQVSYDLTRSPPPARRCSPQSRLGQLVMPDGRERGQRARQRPHATGRRYQARRLRRHFFFLAVSAARRAAHTGHKADGNTAGGVPSPGRRNPGIVPWTSVPWTYSHSVNTSGSRVLRLRRSTRSKASRRSIMLLQVLRRLDRLRFPCRASGFARISAAIHPGSVQVEVRPHSDTSALT